MPFDPAIHPLTALEARVLATLMEKARTVPDSYPLTLNAVVTGCNQKTSRDPVMNWFLLRAPCRLVIDLPRTEFAFDPRSLKSAGIVTSVRYGDAGEGRSRVILTSKKPFKVERVYIPAAGADGKVPVSIELKNASRAEFDAALAEQGTTTASTGPKAETAAENQVDGKFTIVIDPGHGGIDGGAKSPNGTVEKEITLAFGLELKEKLQESGRYNVLMTRDADNFIPLDARVAFARKHGAKRKGRR